VYERNEELGGQINIAAKAPLRHELGDVVRFLRHELKRLNVDVRLGVEATAEDIKAENPDTVIVATGSVPIIPPLPGVEGNENVVTYWDILQEKATAGKKVVIIDDEGHDRATSVAEFLMAEERQVEILTKRPMIAEFLYINDRVLSYQRLLEMGVKFTPHTGLKEISGKDLITYNIYTQQEVTIADVDTIVFCIGNQAKDDLYLELERQVDDLHMVGDCVVPRRILDAIHEGAHIGTLI
jgi:thioredoxin reductase